MKKLEMLKAVAEKAETTQKVVDSVLAAYADVVIETLESDKDEKVTLPNIGTFSVKDVPERRGKIMMGDRKGEEYVVPQHREPKIKLSKSFKEILL